MLYGANVWDPVLIVAQIISIQCLYYLSLGLWLAMFLAPYLGRITVSYLFDWRHMSFKHFAGWMVIVSNLANAPMVAVYLLWVVERAKKCLDFGSTCYLLHFFITWSWHGFPASIAWWVTNGIGMLIAALLGEWLCVRREMMEIPLNSLRNNRAAAAGTGTVTPGAGTSSGHASAAVSPSAGSSGATPRSGAAGNKLTQLLTGGRVSQGGSRLGVSSTTSQRAQGAGPQARSINVQLTVQQTSGNTQGPSTPTERSLSRANSKTRLLGDDAV